MLDPGLPNPAVLKCWWHVGYACGYEWTQRSQCCLTLDQLPPTATTYGQEAGNDG
jgi:hypothetical protein